MELLFWLLLLLRSSGPLFSFSRSLSLPLLSAGFDLIQQRLGTATTGHHAHLSQSVGDEEEEEEVSGAALT